MPSPALLGIRSFATTIADADGLQPRLPAWVDTPDDLVAAWSRFAPATPDPSTVMGEVQRAITLTVRARKELAGTLHAGVGGAHRRTGRVRCRTAPPPPRSRSRPSS